MKACVMGGAWITAAGMGRLSRPEIPVLGPGPMPHFSARDIFPQPPARFGRFDAYTKAGCACVTLALMDAGFEKSEEKMPVGIVSSSSAECVESDTNFCATTFEADGVFASPNLFSYTVPGVALGECAVMHHLTGPTLCVGEDGGKGLAALKAALRMMADGAAGTMVAGWLDGVASPAQTGLAKDFISGSVFVVLRAGEKTANCPHKEIVWDKGMVHWPDGIEIKSVLELFA